MLRCEAENRQDLGPWLLVNMDEGCWKLRDSEEMLERHEFACQKTMFHCYCSMFFCSIDLLHATGCDGEARP